MGFDILAPHYCWMEHVLAGSRLQRCRTAFIANIDPPGRVLMLGEGTGRCLVEMLARFPRAKFTCVDASGGMIEQMRRSVPAAADGGRIDWVHADIHRWNPDAGQFDLIVSHFFLDCFQAHQLASMIPRLAAAATQRASWLLADFFQPERGITRWRASLILWAMYRFFRVVTDLDARRLTPPDEFLKASGFALRARRFAEWGLLHSDWWVREDGVRQ